MITIEENSYQENTAQSNARHDEPAEGRTEMEVVEIVEQEEVVTRAPASYPLLDILPPHQQISKPANHQEQARDLRILPDYIPAEVSLETIGYFTPSSKRIKNVLTKEKTLVEKTNLDGTRAELKVVIIASGKYGLPITSDLDYYRAFLKILDEALDQESLIPDPISIPTKKLIRYTGKKANARELQEVKDWIRRNRYTGIQGFIYKVEKGDYAEVGDEPLFRKYVLRGQRIENGDFAETNYVWLASWFRSNYVHYRRPIDLNFHQRLRKPIAKSLYPLLETGWYASGGKPYAKSYRDLCQEFLLRQERHLSLIKKQLDPAHKELHREHFLAKWDYHSSVNKKDYTITYYPGEKFFEDQKAREDRRQLAERIDQKFVVHRNPPSLEEEKARRELLVQDILEVTGDRKSELFYRILARKLPDHLIYRAISETKEASRRGEIRKTRGAFFTDTAKRLAEDQGIPL